MQMTCYSARRQSTAYVDGRLRGSGHSEVKSHLHVCESCSSYFEQIASLRSTLRDLPAVQTPVQLKTSLQVIASRERAILERTRGSQIQRLWESWKFRIDNLMRPVALPATGGFLSSVVLFGLLVFTIGTSARIVPYEVPVPVDTESDIRQTTNLVPMELRSKAVFVTVNLDGRGRIRDYAVRDGSASFSGDSSTLPETNVELPDLPGVLALARPITGDIQISFTPIGFRP